MSRKSSNSNDVLAQYSPFAVGLGEFANCITIPLGGEGDGFYMEVWNHGEAKLFDDPLDLPKLIFTPEDAPMLRLLADELESRADEYAEYQARMQEHEAAEGRSEAALEEESQDNAAHSKRATRSASTSPDQPQLVGIDDSERTAPKVAAAGKS